MLMNMDTVAIACFVAVAETLSFTRAAERVGRTQSAVSQQIAKLESWVGRPLFLRGRSLGLTNDGEVFLSYARRILALHNEVFDRFNEPELEGEVAFGLPEDFACVYLSDVLTSFTRMHPRVHLRIECDLTLNLIERFKAEEFDLVLAKLDRATDGIKGREVWTEQIEWVGDSNLLEDDGILPLVLSPDPCVYRARALAALDAVGIKWRIVFSSPSFTSVVAAVEAGMGLTVMPRTMVPDGLETLRGHKLPALADTHISMLCRGCERPAIQSFEEFVLRSLQA